MIGLTAIAFLALGPFRGESVELLVRLQAGALVEPRTLAQTKAIVTHVFVKSGVNVRWIDEGESDVNAGTEPNARFNPVRVLVLTAKPPNVHGDATGFAAIAAAESGEESYAGVLLPSAAALAERAEFPLATILGATIAHEIGHVLLGSSHSLTGVMAGTLSRPQLRMVEAGTLLFLAEESSRLRQAIHNRSR